MEHLELEYLQKTLDSSKLLLSKIKKTQKLKDKLLELHLELLKLNIDTKKYRDCHYQIQELRKTLTLLLK